MKKSLHHSQPVGKGFNRGFDERRAKGGARAGAGRPPDWLKVKCQEIVEKDQLIEFMGDVAAGRNVDFYMTVDGKRVPVPAKIRDRMMAAADITDRGFGKPNQPIEVQITWATLLIAEVNKALHIVPDMCPHCNTKLNLRKDIAAKMNELSGLIETRAGVK